MTEEEFIEQTKQLLATPEGRNVIRKVMAENPISEDARRRIAATYARKHGKSMDTILIELIQSGELTDAQVIECMEGIGMFPTEFDYENSGGTH